jgi:hypothetical protein
MRKFVRTHHRIIAGVLRSLNAELLTEAQCFFGGGTQLAMTFGEYRESRDIDFLCSSRMGFRMLREQVTQQSLGDVLRHPLTLAREVRADRDGIRTFFDTGGARIKFEILLEARIDLAGELDRKLAVPTLSIECAIAEKLLANADRSMDDSTLSRDLVDLAFVVVHAGKPKLRLGMAIAEHVYGAAVQRYLRLALDAFRDNRKRANACIKSLAIEDTATLRKGLRILRSSVA